MARAEREPIGAGPGARGRQPPRRPHAGGRDQADRLDQVVDARVERGEVAAGARRDPAAEGGELERLREMAERQPVRPELRFEIGAERAGLDTRGARHGVDLEHAREGTEVEGARGPPAPAGLDPADYAGAAAVGRYRDARARAGFQRAGDVLFRSRQADEVRRGREVAGEAADEI